MKHYHYVSFCLQDVEFMGYYLPMNLDICENTLSLYEATEKSYNDDVIRIFREIAEELTDGYAVLQWLHGSGVDSVSDEGVLKEERYVVKCSENGVDDDMMDWQMGKENHWNFIEQECFCYREMPKSFRRVEDATEYIEQMPCDLYIMLDLMHAAMMVKTRKAEDLKKVETCMRRICEKHEIEIHDYIGHLTQKST